MAKMAQKKNTKLRLIWVPLELLDQRYTILTRKWYKKEFKKHFNVTIVEGKQLTTKIENGSFLDAYGTNFYKYSQLMKISKMFRDGKIQDGDRFFFDDLWFSGIDGLRYMEKMGKDMNIKIFGVMHAGSWIPSDEVAVKLSSKSWCKEYEKSVFSVADKVFVGSQYHKGTIIKYFNNDNLSYKIINTGLPFYPSDILKFNKQISWLKKENIIVFPHRNHPEKQPKLFDKLCESIKKFDLNWKCVKTCDLNLSKKEFYKLLSKSKIVVSYALQENFGFSVLEALTFGNIVLLPNQVVYPEFYPKECLYFSYDNYCDKISELLFENNEPKIMKKLKKIPYKFEKSISNMIKEMKK